jgi:2-polyprenyl-3-methyl-5-hydroxy-6-metoxy-1,4-benzoquinol methylase
MNPEHIKFLVCPKTKEKLTLEDVELENGRIREGRLISEVSKNEYKIINFIPRFVPLENYAANFGIEWNKHNRTQYDESSGFNFSNERFKRQTKWNDKLAGEILLEVGSGSGRFTKLALNTGAMVISFDFSNAVEANYKSNGNSENLLLVQTSIYEMPFREETFDRVFCFGVIQHTPDPKATFMNLVKMLKPGGSVVSDVYIKSFVKVFTHTKYFVRRFTKNKNPEKLYESVVRYINFIWPLSRLLIKIPGIGRRINWRLMVGDYSGVLKGADEKTLKEWAILDTYDMVSPAYDFPQTLKTFKKWHVEADLTDIDVHYGIDVIVGRAKKKSLQESYSNSAKHSVHLQ